MKRPSDEQKKWLAQREKIIGLGERSLRKTYYPELQQRLEELEQAEEALKKANEELELRVAERTAQLEKSRAELKAQNEDLLRTYRELEEETKQRIRAMEELGEKERLLIQQSRMAAMGEMLGNIAHQWRQPLNVLGMVIQQLQLAYQLGNFSGELLEKNIGKAMDIILLLSQTIDDFRDFSSPDKMKSIFSVKEVLAKTFSLIGESFREQHIEIRTEITGEPQIRGYPNEYSQVLINIFVNARDAFVERGTQDALLTVRVRTKRGRVVVTVADNAGGIGEDIIDRIFDAYFTTRELGKGSGVGLFMAKNIIEKNMGGRLTVRNTDGGAEFRIEV